MSKAASKSRLAALHSMFTEALIHELEEAKSGDYSLAAADKSVISKFLKDNDITASADEAEMQGLKEAFEEELESKRKARAAEIMGSLHGTDDSNNVDFLM